MKNLDKICLGFIALAMFSCVERPAAVDPWVDDAVNSAGELVVKGGTYTLSSGSTVEGGEEFCGLFSDVLNPARCISGGNSLFLRE